MSDELSGIPPETERKGGKQLTPSDLAAIDEMWESGAYTLDAIAEQYLVHKVYLSRLLAKRGVKKGTKSKELAAAATEKVKETLVDVHAKKMVRVAETKDEHYTFAQTLAKLTYQLVANQVKNKSSISAIRDDIRTIKDAMTAIAIARDERFRVLGLDKDEDTGDEVPALIVTEMTAADLENLRDKQKEGLGATMSDEDLEDFVEKTIQKDKDPSNIND